MKLSFAKKLWLPLVLSLFCLAGLAVFNAYQIKQIQLSERRSDLQHVSQIAIGIIASLGEQASQGKLSEKDAKRLAIESVRTMRYGQNGYFTLFDDQKILMHPIEPQRIGKGVGEFKDINGVYLYKVAIAIIKNEGQGFEDYAFHKPGETVASAKLGYNISYRPWGWILQSGAYVDDIDADFLKRLYQNLGILIVLGAVLSVVVAMLNRGIIRSLGGEPGYAIAMANQIAQSDLTGTIESKPGDNTSLLFSMKSMQEQLRRTIETIRYSVNTIASATGQIAAGNQDLSRRTEEQVSSLEETAASMEELAATVTQNADNARHADLLAKQAVGVVGEGSMAISQVVETMQGIQTSSDHIADIVGIIEGIAFQTNILALNAAVEAARAGEHGRGFAVVATEVRSLAQRSATASKEIKGLVEESLERVRTSAGYVENANAKMQAIMQAITRVTDIMGEIAASSHEQSSGIGQVSLAVTQMDAIAQQNAALVEQATAAAHSLESQGYALRSSIAMFKLQDA
ncbi:MAG: methyl-accepting chemotaxis protein [Dyella sp.]